MKISPSNRTVVPLTLPTKPKLGAETISPRFWSKELWPPSSPDLNPMDLSVWSMLETEACRSPHTTVESLKVSLVEALAKIPQKKLRAAVECFRGRIERVIAAEGRHIEK